MPQNGHIKLDLKSLLAVPLPTSSVDINGFEFWLQALSSKTLDDLITKYPPENKEERAWHEDLRFELVALTVTNAELSPEDVRELFDTWARPAVNKLQGAVFELNWTGTETALLPLSETASDETASTPSN